MKPNKTITRRQKNNNKKAFKFGSHYFCPSGLLSENPPDYHRQTEAIVGHRVIVIRQSPLSCGFVTSQKSSQEPFSVANLTGDLKTHFRTEQGRRKLLTKGHKLKRGYTMCFQSGLFCGYLIMSHKLKCHRTPGYCATIIGVYFCLNNHTNSFSLRIGLGS